MKKAFIALSLLNCMAASAAVNLEFTVRFDQESMTRIVKLDEHTIATMRHENGIHAMVSLKEQTENDATVQLVISLKKGDQERELSNETVMMPFGQTRSFVCPAHGVDAAIILRVTDVAAE